jgi:hypothetical protein
MAKEARRHAAYSRLVGDNGLFTKREREREREIQNLWTFAGRCLTHCNIRFELIATLAKHL